MSTELNIICKVNLTKKQVLDKLYYYISEIEKIDPITNPEFYIFKNEDRFELPWEYQIESKSHVRLFNTNRILRIKNSGSFSIYIFKDTITLASYPRYSYIFYKKNDDYFREHYPQYQYRFSELTYRILKLFKGEEIIYLADNGCDKLHDYLNGIYEEKLSYSEVKKAMIKSNTPVITNYFELDYEKLNYRDIKQFMFDDLRHLKHIFSIPKVHWDVLTNLIPKTQLSNKCYASVQLSFIDACQMLGVIFYDINLIDWHECIENNINPISKGWIDEESSLLELTYFLTLIIRTGESNPDYLPKCFANGYIFNCLTLIKQKVIEYEIK